MTLEKCPLCDTHTLKPSSTGRVQVYKCTNCSIVTSPPNIVQPTSYYEQEYSLTSTVRNSTEFHRYFRYPEYQRLLGLVTTKAKPPSTLLDIGCDHGYFLDDARRYGFHTIGVEPSDRGRRYAHSIGLHVEQSLNDVTEMSDVVTMWHVLEHIANPKAVLQDISSKMNAHGWLFVRVPDYASIPSRILKDKWIWFQPHHHAIHYTRRTLRHVLETSGFEVHSIRSQRPNSFATMRAYHLAVNVMRTAHGLQRPGLRGLAARFYQDITGVELLAVARLQGAQ